ncbi:TraR/DksA C4-type zinc finger protein [Nonomuraea sp. NPDC049695]|uniref:TraR/DksA C4-type zinc finger protein n=1 Tax=Nonomuraea sp. NPDC049695 TaxID=3154734 RepID=UPI00342D5B73
MADDRSVHTHLQHYAEDMARLEELRKLLHDQLTTADSRPTSDPALQDDARRRIAAIRAALERMDRGLYGICQCCGAFIAFDQLRRAPDRIACDGCAHARRDEAAA